MKTMAFASRNTKEILRDPLTVGFGLGFPLILLFLLTAIQSNVPVEIFEINHLTSGIIIFGFSFISLFSGMLIAKDRSTSFLLRLYSSPLTAANFILGYTLPLFVMALAQSAVCLIAAAFLGMKISVGILAFFAVLLPASILFIALGLLCGSFLTDKQVGGICGALLTNLVAWLSGTWFDLNLVGGAFKKIADALPFVHGVDAGTAALEGNYSEIFPDLWWVIAYAAVVLVLSLVIFSRRMQKDQ